MRDVTTKLLFCSELLVHKRSNAGLSLVVEVVDLLHVAKDDVLLVGDARRKFLHAVGHLPQVVLTRQAEKQASEAGGQTPN